MFVNDRVVAQSRPFDSTAFCRECLRERVPPFECLHASFNFIPGREKPQTQNPGLRYGCDLFALSSFLNHQNLIGLDVLAPIDFP
jgi:hypothetical protein